MTIRKNGIAQPVRSYLYTKAYHNIVKPIMPYLLRRRAQSATQRRRVILRTTPYSAPGRRRRAAPTYRRRRRSFFAPKRKRGSTSGRSGFAQAFGGSNAKRGRSSNIPRSNRGSFGFQPTTSFLTSGSGQALQKNFPVKSGSNTSPTGKLVLATNYAKCQRIYKAQPHTMMTRIYLSEVNIDAAGSIGNLSLVESISSVSAEKLSLVMVNLGAVESLAVQAASAQGGGRVGNHTIPAPGYTNTGATQNVSCLHMRSNALNTAYNGVATMITRDKVPDIARSMLASATETVTPPYHLPNMAITGWKIRLVIRPISQLTQFVTVKLVRRNQDQPSHWNEFATNGDQQIFSNSAMTSGRYFDTLWSCTRKLEGISKLNKDRSHDIKIDKNIRCMLARTTLRKVYEPEDANVLGAGHKPQFVPSVPNTHGTQALQNQCYLVISSRLQDDKYLMASQQYELITAETGIQTGNTYDNVSLTAATSVAVGQAPITEYAKFSYGGVITQYNRCSSWNQGIV